MLTIRPYREADAGQVGILIADTYNEFNLSGLTARQREELLAPFLQACAPTVLVAEIDGQIVGILRGGRADELGRAILQSLFVSGSHHRQGIGQKLVECFEQEYVVRGVTVFKLLATLYAIPFWLAMGYRKSTGVRLIHSFEGRGLPSQPMKKIVSLSQNSSRDRW